MGACASSFKVLKDAGDAAPEPEKEEVAAASREVILTEDVLQKDDSPAGVAAEDDNTKCLSLGQVFENEGRKISVEDNANASEGVKQEVERKAAKPHENGNVKSPERVVVDAQAKDETVKPPESNGPKPATSEETKPEDVKPASESAESEVCEKKTEEKPTETTKPEKSQKVEEENKADEKSPADKKPEIPETTTKAEEAKKSEEKPAGAVKVEKAEEKPVEIVKVEKTEKVEDKQVVEPVKAEKPVENKADESSAKDKKPKTPETKNKEEPKK